MKNFMMVQRYGKVCKVCKVREIQNVKCEVHVSQIDISLLRKFLIINRLLDLFCNNTSQSIFQFIIISPSCSYSQKPADRQAVNIKDIIICTTRKAVVENKMEQVALRRVVAYIEYDNSVIGLITNNMNWSAATIAKLYKRRWMIEFFFKLII